MNIVSQITRHSNLDANDSLSAFRGHTAQQSHLAYEVFYNFLKETAPKRILEIGTALGGFTQFLKICCDDLQLDTNIRSYDISARPWYKDMVGIDVRVENIFNSNFTECNPEVIDFIQQSGTTIVLCDGGWKVGEFNLFATKIKVGDYILAHDYAENREIFESTINRKIWNWMEIQESDIKNACIQNNLVDYKRTDFNGAAWICKNRTA
jgi:hypothetical protein